MSQLRRTKILATLGPATDAPGVLDELIRAGVNVVRMNFSHGTPEQHAARVAAVREASQRQGREVGILADLQGPKIRIGSFRDGSIVLTNGDGFRLDLGIRDGEGDIRGVGLEYKELADCVERGDSVLGRRGTTPAAKS